MGDDLYGIGEVERDPWAHVGALALELEFVSYGMRNREGGASREAAEPPRSRVDFRLVPKQ